MTKADFLEVDGFKDKSATKIHNGIHTKISEATLAELMQASNSFGRGFGERRFTGILNQYPDVITSDESNDKKIKKLLKVDGVARKTAERFVEDIPDFVKFMTAAKLTDKFIEKPVSVESINTGHPLYGKKIVFTGGKDKELIEDLKDVGADVANVVSKTSFVVIAKTHDEDTGKADAARKLGIPIMTVEEFREKYGL